MSGSMTTGPDSPAPAQIPGRGARVLDRALSGLLRLPGRAVDYQVERGLRIPTRDGFTLLTDHFSPVSGPGRGTVMIRTPYGRDSPTDIEARVYASRGYHVVLQSVRGTSGSGGEFDPMANEAPDGQDAVAWLRTQPWFDGRLATAGASYMGWTQWALLTEPPPELHTAIVMVGPHDLSGTAYGTGAFYLSGLLSWSELIVTQERYSGLRAQVRNATAGRRLAPAVRRLPLADSADQALGHQAPWFRRWLTHPDRADPFWERLKASSALERADVPVRLVAGWQDLFLEQSMHQYQVLHRRGIDVTLTVGPWSHLQLATKGFGAVLRGNLDWLAEHLAAERAAARTDPVRIYVTGHGGWRDLADWPPLAAEDVRYLLPGGRLGDSPPAGPGPSTSFYYDPADPTPTVGGRLLTIDAGVHDNRKLEARPDVLTFTTPPLETAVEITGAPVVELSHSRDNQYADIFVRLCDVDPKGRSRNFSDAHLRLNPAPGTAVPPPADEPQTLRLELDPCAHRLAPGHRLRLQVSGGSFPRFDRNEGTGAAPGTGTELRPCTHTVYHTTGAASRVILPVSP